MVKRTNRIHNLDKMILEYKQEEEKFKVIEEEISNQQKEIEDLRLLILSTNFMNTNQLSNSVSDTSKSFNNLSSFSKDRTLTKKKINDCDLKSKVTDQTKMNTIKLKTNKNLRSDELDGGLSGLEKPSHFNRSNQLSKFAKLNSSTPINQTKPKGLQTISKNILNQKDNKYLNDKDSSKKTDNLFKKTNSMKTPTHSSIDLINRLNKIKSTMNLNKLENQENPKECLGLNQSSKSINKKTRQIKSNLKSSTKLTNSNRQLQRV